MDSNNKYSVAICDDNRTFAGNYARYVERIMKSELEVDCEVDQYFDCESLLEAYQQGKRYDILFLDINFGTGKIDGINFTERLRHYDVWVKIIYVTSNEHAAEALVGHEASGYIRKSKFNVHTTEQLKAVIDRMKRLYIRVPIYTSERVAEDKMINTNDIAYFENRGRLVYVIYYDGDKGFWREERVRGTISEWDERLRRDPLFVRINQSHIVNYAQVRDFIGRDVYFYEKSFGPFKMSSRGLSDLNRARMAYDSYR